MFSRLQLKNYVWTPLPNWCFISDPMFDAVRLLQQLVPGKRARRRDSSISDLRVELSKALESGHCADALDLFELFEAQMPDEPRWSRRKGDLLRRLRRDAEAVLAYERAFHVYAARGFVARAEATAKLISAIDPSIQLSLEQLNPDLVHN